MRLALAALLALGGLGVRAPSALANGGSRTIYMSYLAGMSNWGPRDATATATVNVGEGTIHLVATGLPSLVDEVYQVWLVTADRETWATLGRFAAGATEQMVYEGEVAGVEVLDYRYLILTVEPTEDLDPAPSNLYSIGGIFPNAEALPAEWSMSVARSAAAAEGTALAAAAPPEYLPETGVELSSSFGAGLVALVTGLCLAWAVGVGTEGDADARSIRRQ